MPKSKVCYFTKSNILVDSKTFALLNIKTKIHSNKINNKYKIRYKHPNQFYNKENIDDNENYNNYDENDYENNYDNNYYRHKKNNYNNFNDNFNDFNSYFRGNNNIDQNKFVNTSAFNNYMNNRLISPEILISKNRNKSTLNIFKTTKKSNDIPKSPYLQSKFSFKNPMNKNNSVINMINNNKKNNRFPIIKQNHLSKNASNTNLNLDNFNDINLNCIKNHTIFNNHQSKKDIYIPIVSNKSSIRSVNNQKLNNNNMKTTELSSPISNDPQNKFAFDLKYIHNLKKGKNEKGYGKHYGSEKDCPVCQSILMKNNYLMKQMNNYKDLNKFKDNERIKINKEQFLQDLKKPNSKIQKEEANIIRQIRYFLNSSKRSNNYNEINNINDEGNIINAYFGL